MYIKKSVVAVGVNEDATALDVLVMELSSGVVIVEKKSLYIGAAALTLLAKSSNVNGMSFTIFFILSHRNAVERVIRIF